MQEKKPNLTHCESIIDITIASENMYSGVNNWKVNLEACTSSDHHAIEYSIRTPHIERQQTRESTYLFNNKTANWDKFHEQFDIQFNSSGLHQVGIAPDPRSIDSTV